MDHVTTTTDETIFTWEVPTAKYGVAAADEVAYELLSESC